MMKILHVVGAMDMGGAETMLMNTMRVIDRKNYKFIFLCYINTDRKYVYEDEVVRLGGKIIRINDTRRRNPRRFIKDIERVIKKEQIDVVHGHVDLSSAYAVVAAKKADVMARITHSHNAWFSAENSLPGRVFGWWARRTILRNTNVRIAVEGDAGRAMYGKAGFLILKNGIDFERFKFSEKARRKARHELGVGGNETLVLHVGRFEKAKNHEFVIDAFSRFVEHGNEARLLLIGAGSLESLVREKITSLGLQDKVTILSNVQNVEQYYSASDIFIFPSFFEGLGMVLVEAQVNGLPCLASDNIEDVIKLSNRIERLPISDAQLWAERMHKFRMGRDGQKVLSDIKCYSIHETAQELCKIYDNAGKPRVVFHIADITKAGGTERVTLQVANMLKDKYQVSIVSTMRSGLPFFDIEKDVRAFYLYDKKISAKKDLLGIILRLRKLLQAERFDIVIGVDTMQSFFDLLASVGRGVKYVAWEHFNHDVNLGKKMRDVGRRMAAKSASRIVVLTDADAKIWRSNISDVNKVRRIYNSVEIKSEKGVKYDSESRVLLSAGRLAHQKGFDMIPEIAKKMVIAGCDDFEWWVVGDGEDHEKIAAKIREHGVGRFVKLRGNVKDMQSVYSKVAMFVSTSRFEGLPLVLLEAKQCNLPIVSFDYVMGVNEIVRNDVNGFIVELGDTGKMAEKLTELLNDKNRRVGFSNASRLDVDKFSEKRNAMEWHKVLEEAING